MNLGGSSGSNKASSGSDDDGISQILPIVIGLFCFTMVAVIGIIFYYVKILPEKIATENMPMMSNLANATTHNNLFDGNQEEPNPYFQNANSGTVIGSISDPDLFSPVRV